MKLDGQELHIPYEKEVLVRRDNPKDSKLIKFKTVPNAREQFKDILAPPKAPVMTNVKTGKKTPKEDDPKYLKEVDEYTAKGLIHIFLTSIQGVEWETVDLKDPSTYENYIQEMIDAGLTEREVETLYSVALTMTMLSVEMVDEADKDFLAEVRAQAKNTSTLITEKDSTPSTESANDSENGQASG